MPGGHGIDDYAGLLYTGRELTSVLSARRGAGVWRVDQGDGGAEERKLDAELIEAEEQIDTAEDIAEFRRATRGRQRAGWLG